MTLLPDNNASDALITLSADIVAAHVSNNSVSVSDVPALIANVHSALAGLSTPSVPVEVAQEPAVSVRSSIKPGFIVCLEDGKKLKMLKRHLMTHYQMTPAEYRAKWGLPSDYPMVAPNYALQRKELALKIGLGRKPGVKVSAKAAPKGKAKAKATMPIAAE
jgi:predicted transcriptional regulator